MAFCLFGACGAATASNPGTVVAWGTGWNGSAYAPVTVPGGLTNATAIAAGYGDSLALKTDTTVVAWGFNSSGQTNVPPGLSNVVNVAAGAEHCLALKQDGTVVVWGYNYFGQTNIPAGLNNVRAIAAGGDHSLALRSNGTVVAWGYNNSGQTNVPAGLTNVAAVAVGYFHSLALQSNGTVVAWGGNSYNQTNVPSGLSNVVAIAAGADHSLALQANGQVKAWGSYFNGVVYVPITVPAGLGNVMAIACGGGFSLALLSNATVVAWGTYFNGSEYVPMTAPAGLTNVVAIAAGYFHSLAIALGAGPVIVSAPPPSISLGQGDSTNLSVTVSAASPFGCQWFTNGVPIPGATATSLLITDFDLTNAGVYSIVVSNQIVAVTNSSVVRLLNSPVVRVDGADVGGGTVARVDASVQVTITNGFDPDAEIYYTLDGSDPWFGSATLYAGAFTLATNATVRAIGFNFDQTDWAEAAPIQVQIWPSYPLSASTPGGGSIGLYPAPNANNNRYVSNTPVTLTATPLSGWSFMKWLGISSTTNPATVLMNAAQNVQAIFGTPLTLATNGHGRILLDPTPGPYAYGSTVQLTAMPDTNSYFFHWAGAASGFNNPLLIHATNTSTITAVFTTNQANQVSLTALPSGQGTVAVSPFKNVYTIGETVTLTASPAGGNIFKGWSGDVSVTNNPLTLLLDASKYITGNFDVGTATNPPVITWGPPSGTAGPGDSTTLSFQLTGDGPFTYQWQFNGAPITGATGPALTLTNFSAAQVGLYSVLVTGQVGTATSPAASVAVFSVDTAQAGDLTFPLLFLNGLPGATYRLEYGTDLSNWTLLAPVTLQDRELYYVDDPLTDHSRRFYRAVPQ